MPGPLGLWGPVGTAVHGVRGLAAQGESNGAHISMKLHFFIRELLQKKAGKAECQQ